MSDKVYQVITDQIIAGLEKGVVPWRKPWRVAGLGPMNGKSGKAYRGINVFVLAITRLTRGFGSPVWLSYKQATELGGKVIPGSKGTPVTFWKRLEVEDAETGKKKNIMLMRYFTVFNLDQTEGVKLPKKVANVVNIPAKDGLDTEPVDSAEAIMARYLGELDGPDYNEGGGIDRAYYVPSTDGLFVPDRGSFESMGEFYLTVFHEFGHSTGSETRLKRTGVLEHNGFGSVPYSQEELVAEMTAAFVGGEANISTPETIENSKNYIGGWLSKLKADPKLVVQAAGQAQKAADHILGITWENAS
jgi:antirestriction protein ArdC